MAKIDRVQEVALAELKPYERNAKLHPEEQIQKIAKSIEEFGFVNPVLIDENKNVIAGHGRIEAAKRIGLEKVPCVYVEGLTDEQRRAYILADNKIFELGAWNDLNLKTEMSEVNFDFDFLSDESQMQVETEKHAIICPRCGMAVRE